MFSTYELIKTRRSEATLILKIKVKDQVFLEEPDMKLLSSGWAPSISWGAAWGVQSLVVGLNQQIAG